MTKLCRTCQTEQQIDALFCVDCGASLAATGATQRLRVGAATERLEQPLRAELLDTMPPARARAAKLPQPAPVEQSKPKPQKLAINMKAAIDDFSDAMAGAASALQKVATGKSKPKPPTIGGVSVPADFAGVVVERSIDLQYDGVYCEDVVIETTTNTNWTMRVELTLLNKQSGLSIGAHVTAAELTKLREIAHAHSVSYSQPEQIDVSSWGDTYKSYIVGSWSGVDFGGSAVAYLTTQPLQTYGTAALYPTLTTTQEGE